MVDDIPILRGRGRPLGKGLSEEEKKNRKKAANARYYNEIKDEMRIARKKVREAIQAKNKKM